MIDTNELRAKVARAVDAWEAANGLLGPRVGDPFEVMVEANRLWLAEHPAGDDDPTTFDEVCDALHIGDATVSSCDGVVSADVTFTVRTKGDLRRIMAAIESCQTEPAP